MDAIPKVVAMPPIGAATATALVFVKDRDSEGVIRQCLSDLGVTNVQFRNGDVDTAIAELAARPSPSLVIVDVQGVDDPTSHVLSLADVCDPTTGVVVIGDQRDIPFYRGLKTAGVAEYFFKPLVRILVLQTLNGIITGSSTEPAQKTGKLVMTVCVRGGCGATMITVATAYYLAETLKRRVAVLDLDLQFGDAALQLGTNPSHALEEALAHPERVDELFLDRATASVDERLGVLAALGVLDDIAVPSEAAVLQLMELLLRRNRYVFVDMPTRMAAHLMHLLHLPSTVLLVSSSSLVSARDIVRLRERIGSNSAERVILHILNKAGADDGLSLEEFTRATGVAPDIVIPNDRDIAIASRLGVTGLAKCAPLQRSLAPLFQQLSGETPVAAPRSWLRGLFGSS